MSLTGSGLSDSGIDRALRLALDKELDTQLATGELFDGERARFPEPMPEVEVNRPWQFPIGEKRTAPRSMRQLQGDRSVQQAIGALREPDRAHAAGSELSYQSIAPDDFLLRAGPLCVADRGERVEKVFWGRAGRQQAAQLVLEQGRRHVQCLEPGQALLRGQLQRFIEQPVQLRANGAIHSKTHAMIPLRVDWAASARFHATCCRVGPELPKGRLASTN